MYLHCRHGFVEADAWDGQPVPVVAHRRVMDTLAMTAGTVIVCRARRADTLSKLVESARLPRGIEGGVLPRIEVIRSPEGWDYEWRVYLTAVEWAQVMSWIAMDLDYRNFKHTAQDGHGIDKREYKLALAIWTAAFNNVDRDTKARRFDKPQETTFDLGGIDDDGIEDDDRFTPSRSQ